MRSISILLLGAVVASCTAVPDGPMTRSVKQQEAFARLTSDKVAGPPVSCLPSYQQNDMTIIDGRTVAFRMTASTVNVANLSGGCELLGTGAYAMQTRSFGQGLCSGDIATVIDTMNRGMSVGSCVVGAIVPYRKLGG